MNKETTNIEETIKRVGYIISVSESFHPADTQQRKINLMVDHAKKAIADLKEIKKILKETYEYFDICYHYISDDYHKKHNKCLPEISACDEIRKKIKKVLDVKEE